ncbi:MAG TPA: hypothetical protein VIF83_00355 [Gemmatimonadaceae bacterium]
MKLKFLVLAAGLLILPAIARGQDTTKKATDTTMKAADTTVKDTTTTKTTTTDTAATTTTTTTTTTLTTVPTPPPTTGPPGPNTPTGKECPLGCPTSKGALGLTGVQFLALQQELRDRGCGTKAVTGRADAATRRAIRVCAQRLKVANNARAVLIAMNIGFGETDIPAGGP